TADAARRAALAPARSRRGRRADRPRGCVRRTPGDRRRDRRGGRRHGPDARRTARRAEPAAADRAAAGHGPGLNAVRNSAWLTYDYLEMDWFTVPQREGRHEHEHE